MTEEVSSLVLAFKPAEVEATARTMFNDDTIHLDLFPRMIEFKTAQESAS